jgi:hypothetical protein
VVRRYRLRRRLSTLTFARPFSDRTPRAWQFSVGRLLDPDLCCSCVGRSGPVSRRVCSPDPALSHRHARPPAAVNAGHFHPMPAAARRPAPAGYPLACQPSRYPSARPGMTHRDEQRMLPTDQKHPYRRLSTAPAVRSVLTQRMQIIQFCAAGPSAATDVGSSSIFVAFRGMAESHSPRRANSSSGRRTRDLAVDPHRDGLIGPTADSAGPALT